MNMWRKKPKKKTEHLEILDLNQNQASKIWIVILKHKVGIHAVQYTHVSDESHSQPIFQTTSIETQ